MSPDKQGAAPKNENGPENLQPRSRRSDRDSTSMYGRPQSSQIDQERSSGTGVQLGSADDENRSESPSPTLIERLRAAWAEEWPPAWATEVEP
jgi:hypothetical protein